ncbi:hypothetical protein Mapa_014122 [Marchantia paleacea]|nr:hypothetical protein Mapa_014122 [Marchantia paleacea]
MLELLRLFPKEYVSFTSPTRVTYRATEAPVASLNRVVTSHHLATSVTDPSAAGLKEAKKSLTAVVSVPLKSPYQIMYTGRVPFEPSMTGPLW